MVPPMATTVSVSEETRRKLMGLKLEEGKRSVDELLQELLIEHRKLKFREASELFQRKLTEEGIELEDLIE